MSKFNSINWYVALTHHCLRLHTFHPRTNKHAMDMWVFGVEMGKYRYRDRCADTREHWAPQMENESIKLFKWIIIIFQYPKFVDGIRCLERAVGWLTLSLVHSLSEEHDIFDLPAHGFYSSKSIDILKTTIVVCVIIAIFCSVVHINIASVIYSKEKCFSKIISIESYAEKW